MKIYNLTTKQIELKDVLIDPSGTFFIANLQKEKLKELGYLEVVEESFDEELETLEYKEIGGVYKGVKKDRDDKAEIIKLKEYELWKVSRANAVENIEVTLNNCKPYGTDESDNEVIFQGDETSQNRIARALSVASSASLTSTLWTAKNNKVYELKIEQLAQILLKAGQAQTALWNTDRPE
ncbi:hypothetical protein CFT12S00416_05505 [Campylobacter fetus subsp. testudinum]|uniref:DUF4376 domain-containing protein n=1 Tax=Campylobacter fetus TaxID=196 RepID=UPI000818C10B|nr:hypothetical protein [Campylobacter fetus]OCR88880.1 hypothetical protein CFT12S00416_05505 [Campylobacter fetus subsp. testudinum]